MEVWIWINLGRRIHRQTAKPKAIIPSAVKIIIVASVPGTTAVCMSPVSAVHKARMKMVRPAKMCHGLAMTRVCKGILGYPKVHTPNSHCIPNRHIVIIPSHECNVYMSGTDALLWNLKATYTPNIHMESANRCRNPWIAFRAFLGPGMFLYAIIADHNENRSTKLLVFSLFWIHHDIWMYMIFDHSNPNQSRRNNYF